MSCYTHFCSLCLNDWKFVFFCCCFFKCRFPTSVSVFPINQPHSSWLNLLRWCSGQFYPCIWLLISWYWGNYQTIAPLKQTWGIWLATKYQSTDNINNVNPCPFHVIHCVTPFASPPVEDEEVSVVFIIADGRCQEIIGTGQVNTHWNSVYDVISMLV